MGAREELQELRRIDELERKASGQVAPPTKGSKLLDIAGGIGEGLTNAVTGTAGAALGGLEGLATLATGGSVDDAAGAVNSTAEGLTYAPRTSAGQTTAKVLALPMTLAGDAGKYVGGGIGQAVGGDQGRIAGESIGEAGNQMALTLMGGSMALGKNKARVLKKAEAAAEKAAAAEAAGEPPPSRWDAIKAHAGPAVVGSILGHLLAPGMGELAGAVIGPAFKGVGRSLAHLGGRTTKNVLEAKALRKAAPAESIPQTAAIPPEVIRQQIQEARSQAAGAEAAGPVPRPPAAIEPQSAQAAALEAELAAYAGGLEPAAPGAPVSLPIKPKLSLTEVRRLQAEAAALRGE